MNLKLWLVVLPEVVKAAITIAVTIEEIIPEGGWGNEKLTAVDEILQDVLEASDDIEVQYSIIRPRVHKIISVLVALFNATGKFKK